MKILIASVTDSGIFRVRGELIERLLFEGHKIVIAAPRTSAADKLESLGCTFINVPIQPHGMHLREELSLIAVFRKILRKERPEMLITFTIKPNLYLGLINRFSHIAKGQIMNITGLGEALMHEGRTQRMLIKLYPIATSKASVIFFQNEFNRQFFINHKMADPGVFRMLPGSGVNLQKYSLEDYPTDDNGVHFLFVSRLVKDKGVDELIEAIRDVKQRHPEAIFHFVGGCSDSYKSQLEQWQVDGLVTYHGRVDDMKPLYAMSHCVIHPSYHEGMANVLLEAAALGRPAIASNINGCKEAINEGLTGFLCEVRSSRSIVEKIEEFLKLPNSERQEMGLRARKKMEQEFDRKIVVDAYVDAIQSIANSND